MRILLIQGHPDAAHPHLCTALENSYAAGAASGGHEVRHIQVAALTFPLLQSQREWEHGALPESLHQCQSDIAWAQHIVFFFPLWLGDMPALLKGFLEQVARPGFALAPVNANQGFPKKALTGRSAHIVVTMGMPGLVYRFYFRGHSIKSMKRNILNFVGIAPVKDTVIGMAAQLSPDKARRWLERMADFGRAAA
ncbi:MAG: NAD(P)H-dependent oxidoreductase [Pseudomonadota bacterium]